MWYLYIVEASDQTLYTGITTDLSRREREHNGEKPGGSKYLAGRRPVHIVYTERHTTRKEASIREYAIKCLTRTDKLKLIQGSR